MYSDLLEKNGHRRRSLLIFRGLLPNTDGSTITTGSIDRQDTIKNECLSGTGRMGGFFSTRRLCARSSQTVAARRVARVFGGCMGPRGGRLSIGTPDNEHQPGRVAVTSQQSGVRSTSPFHLYRYSGNRYAATLRGFDWLLSIGDRYAALLKLVVGHLSRAECYARPAWSERNHELVDAG